MGGVIKISLVKSEPLTVNVCACDAEPTHLTNFTKLEFTVIWGFAIDNLELIFV